MTDTFTYIIGIPGSGKSTALAKATAHLATLPLDKPLKHVALLDPDNDHALTAVELGHRRPLFPGTDALSRNVQPRAVSWIATHHARHLIAEGDRLANPSFLDAILNSDYTLRLVWLDTPTDLAASRRAARSTVIQNPSWVNGRITKIRNLTDTYETIRLDGTLDPDTIAAELRQLLNL
jgi:gluconate kinase